MFFGKYLLENGVVTSEQLVDAIIIQMESLPSVVKVIRKNKLLKHDEIIDLFSKSLNEGKNILELIAEMEILSQEQMSKLIEDRCSEGRGLCEVLVNEGYASSMMLNEYVGRYFESQEQTNKSNDDGVLGFNVKGEFVKIFDEELLELFKKDIKGIVAAEREQFLFDIMKNMTLLATVSGMGELGRTAELIQVWLDVLERTKGVSNKNHWIEVASGLRNMINLIWSVRECIAREGSEARLMGDKDWKIRYDDGIRRARYLLKEAA